MSKCSSLGISSNIVTQKKIAEFLFSCLEAASDSSTGFVTAMHSEISNFVEIKIKSVLNPLQWWNHLFMYFTTNNYSIIDAQQT